MEEGQLVSLSALPGMHLPVISISKMPNPPKSIHGAKWYVMVDTAEKFFLGFLLDNMVVLEADYDNYGRFQGKLSGIWKVSEFKYEART